MTPQRLREQTEADDRSVRRRQRAAACASERVYVTGRSHSVPCRLYLPTVRDNSAAMMVYFHFGGGVVGSLDTCHRLCGLIAKEAGAPVLSVDYRLAPEHQISRPASKTQRPRTLGPSTTLRATARRWARPRSAAIPWAAISPR